MSKSIFSIKRKKPVFEKQDKHKRNRLKNTTYRKPKGYTSPQRLQVRGRKAVVKNGYRNPKSVRGLHNRGAFIVVKNLSEARNVSKKALVLLSKTIGLKKKILIVNELKSKGVTFINFKINAFEESSSKKLAERKTLRTEFLKRVSDKSKKAKSVKKEDKKKTKDVKSLETFESGKSKPVKSKQNKASEKIKNKGVQKGTKTVRQG